jgi:hypothetical protein
MKHLVFPIHGHPHLHAQDFGLLLVALVLALLVFGIVWFARHLPAIPETEQDSHYNIPAPYAPW